MRRLLLAAAAALLLAGPAAAAKAPSKAPAATEWKDKAYGYSIVLPQHWYVIPRTKKGIQQGIAYLKAHKQTSLASAYSAILKSPESVAELEAYRFQAFLWPPLKSLVPTEVSLQIPKAHVKPSQLAAVGNTYARALAQNKGAKIATPKRLKLPAGAAEYVTGTIPNGGGVSTGLELYIFVHKGRAYVLSCKIDAKVLSQAKVFRSIAAHFGWL